MAELARCQKKFEDKDRMEEGELIQERLYVGDLEPGALEDHQLAHLFSQFGEVTDSAVIGHRGYGFVTFKDAAVVSRLVEMREPVIVAGRRLILRQARRRKSSVREEWNASWKRNTGTGTETGGHQEEIAGKEQGSSLVSRVPGSEEIKPDVSGESYYDCCVPKPDLSFQWHQGPDGWWYSTNSMTPQLYLGTPHNTHNIQQPQNTSVVPQFSYYVAPYYYYGQGVVTPDGSLVYPVFVLPPPGWVPSPCAPGGSSVPVAPTCTTPVWRGPQTCSDWSSVTYGGTYQAPALVCTQQTTRGDTIGGSTEEDNQCLEAGMTVENSCEKERGAVSSQVSPSVGMYNEQFAQPENFPSEQEHQVSRNKSSSLTTGSPYNVYHNFTGHHQHTVRQQHPINGQGVPQGREQGDTWMDYRGHRKYRMDMYGNWQGGYNHYYRKNYKKKRVFKKEDNKEEIGPQPDLLQGPLENLEIA